MHRKQSRPASWLTVIKIAGVLLATALPAAAGDGKIIKVLPQFMDLKGQTSISPSLYDRDAYQALLRQHPERRSGLRFQIQWKTSGTIWDPLRLRVEMRGPARGDVPTQRVLETLVQPTGWLGRWTPLDLSGVDFRSFGELTAWRVTLWEGDQLLGEQKSFLW